MATIEVQEETEGPGGWNFDVDVAENGQDDAPRRIQLRLAWPDYDLWCGGSAPPEAVAAAVLRFLIERDGVASLREKFDAAIVRRLHGDADAVIPGMVRRG